ncbi:2-dehydro-3-deoxygluconokinase [Chitinophaga skermanii]|uniref:2-dehydro-3-deoxygluconokinase n=1 Tax=Chitinophaga skermanii TaxID=331697 RepID=A0A327R2I5_9BACT|nr:sugar kinase [Chitinophaga skermanii]RAJ11049.1 2-dehydro-3-deoxygluconokinase [Chitinophaga skermanii]
MKTVQIITTGEILFRISPNLQTNEAAIYVGGAEANVAAALGNWGNDVAYVSRVPQNGLSIQALSILQDKNIVTERMLFGGDRIGTYYLAQGADLKHAEVVYDRKYSSFSTIQPGSVNWEEVLSGAQWLHWSAITPALSEDAAAVCKEVLEAAKALGMTISTDLNYRAKLWQYGKQPVEVMPSLTAYCDVIMGNIWAANNMLGTSLNQALIDQNNQEAYLQAAREVATEIQTKYPHCKHIAFTYRFSNGPQHNLYYAVYWTNGELYCSKTYDTNEVVDRVGSGDSFMAGLIHALVHQYDAQKTISFAAAAAYSKLFLKGDFNTTPLQQIEQLM